VNRIERGISDAAADGTAEGIVSSMTDQPDGVTPPQDAEM